MQGTLLIALSAVPLLSGGTDVKTIIQRSVTANQRDWKVAPEDSYIEGVLKNNQTKTYRVLMLEGSPFKYLLKVNGEPLPRNQQQKQRQELRQAIQRRKNETPQKREERLEHYRAEPRRNHRMNQ
jgi:uncharacterized membrane protein